MRRLPCPIFLISSLSGFAVAQAGRSGSCPHSHATRNNVPVELEIEGA